MIVLAAAVEVTQIIVSSAVVHVTANAFLFTAQLQAVSSVELGVSVPIPKYQVWSRVSAILVVVEPFGVTLNFHLHPRFVGDQFSVASVQLLPHNQNEVQSYQCVLMFQIVSQLNIAVGEAIVQRAFLISN